METTGKKPPKDKYHIVYLILLLHGIGILMPWNMFITARSYFIDYKMSKNYTGEDREYATYLISSVGFASQVPHVGFSWINVFINIRGSTTPRIASAIAVEMLVFAVTIALAIVDTSRHLVEFFWSTIATIVVLNMANGIFQNTTFGLSTKLPSKFPGALILGSNISGTLVSFVEFLTFITAPDIKTAAISYFVCALLVLLTCLVTYFIMIHIKFFIYYNLLVTEEVNNFRDSRAIPYWKVFKTASLHLFNLFFIFFVTLTVFPAMQADIKISNPHFIVPEKYYVNIMCFITFNFTAMLGTLISNWINWPSPKFLCIPVLLRGLFVPFFFFCNYIPTHKVRKVPVLIQNDWVYWIAGILLGFTSGYLSNKALLYTIGSVEANHHGVAGKFGAAILVTGVMCGVMFSMVFPSLHTHLFSVDKKCSDPKPKYSFLKFVSRFYLHEVQERANFPKRAIKSFSFIIQARILTKRFDSVANRKLNPKVQNCAESAELDDVLCS